jgi:hypothetical protein
MSFREEILADGVRCILGDCREVLPTLGSVDCVITDPPYGVRDDDWDNMNEREFARFSMSWLSAASLVSQEAMIFGYLDNAVHRLCQMIFPRVRPIIWGKPPGSQLNGAHERGRWFSFEAVFHCYAPEDEGGDVARLITIARQRAGLTRSGVDLIVRGKKTGLCYRWEEGACLPTIEQVAQLRNVLQLGPDFDAALAREYELRAAPAERFDVLSHRTVVAGRHPCEKPIALMEDLIANVEAGGMVLDPFMGSGSTGCAAARLGRGFIGIEREPAYFDIACRRISEALKQPDFFIERPKPIKQEGLAL